MDSATTVTTLLQLFGLLLVAAGLVITSRRQTEAQDTAIVISLGQEYRHRWERGCRDAIERLETGLGVPNPNDQLQLTSMLNWLDWLGVLIMHQVLRKPDLILDTVGPSIARILSLGYPEVESAVAQCGSDYWSGVVEIGARLWKRGLLDPTSFPLFARRTV